MPMKVKNIIPLFLVFSLNFFSGCVGKIEDAAAPATKQASNEIEMFEYSGLVSVNPIAHNKVEIVFKKVEILGSDRSENYRYRLYLNDNENGILINPDSLVEYINNSYYYVVDNLEINTQYSFKIRAFNTVNGSESQLGKEKRLTAMTFSNEVSDFYGISAVSILPGSGNGNDSVSVNVFWNKTSQPCAPDDSSALPNQTFRYEISYSKNPVSILSDLPTGDKFVVNSNCLDEDLGQKSIVIPRDLSTPGLEETYYFRVNALHKNYVQYLSSNYVPIDRERNKKFLIFKLPAYTPDTNFNRENFSVKNAKAEAGYSSFLFSWSQPEGEYFGYKLIYGRVDETTQQFISGNTEANWIGEIDSAAQDVNFNPNSFNNEDRGIHIISDPSVLIYSISSGLRRGGHYRFKLFVCDKSLEECAIKNRPASGENPAVAEVPSFDTSPSIRLIPTLATFLGIYNISSPQTIDDFLSGKVYLDFQPPEVTTGWADIMEFYCIDEDSSPPEKLLTTTAVPPGNKCSGIKLSSTPPTGIGLGNLKKIAVEGLDLNDSTGFTFAATPVLNQDPYNINNLKFPLNSLRRRFIPEIKTPKLSEFSGLNTCSSDSSLQTINVTWNDPSGGLYQRIVIFWKKKDGTPFSFNAAKTGFSNKTASNPSILQFQNESCTDSDTNYCFIKAFPGTNISTSPIENFDEYEFGALPLISLSGTHYWGQENSSILTCRNDVPRADFSEWTRVFAIGPTRSEVRRAKDSEDNFIEEAIDEFGVPYFISESSTFFPPGTLANFPKNSNQEPIPDFTSVIDGIKSEQGAYSKDGIISLAWKEVGLPNFTSLQISEPDLYGYRIYRSEDNGFKWEELTDKTIAGMELSPSLIHSINYTYYVQPNDSSSTIERMAFFTDYSVKQTNNNKNDTGNPEAKIYLYKIVPVYDGKDVEFKAIDVAKATVKVILPPPNMALVHRWMVNRAQCNELGLTLNISDHYSCDFRGLGAVPKSLPFSTNNQKLDIGGDLLVDRQELGCNYTRGNLTEQQNFNSAAFEINNTQDVLTTATNNTGCFKKNESTSPMNSLPGQSGNAASGDPTYSQLLAGDCLGNAQSEILLYRRCSDAEYANSRYPGVDRLMVPGFNGADVTINPANCQGVYSTKSFGIRDPLDTTNFLDESTSVGVNSPSPIEWSLNHVAQAKSLSVFYSSHNSDAAIFPMPILGVDNNALTQVGNHRTRYASHCAINLAAIHNGTHFSRWANLSNFKLKNENVNESRYTFSLLNTPSEIQNSSFKLYDGQNLIAPSEMNDNRPIGRIISSNNADLPPITRINANLSYELCESHQIDLVYHNSDTEAVSKFKTNISKRPLRRREFVASSFWPERYNKYDIDYLEGVSNSPSSNGTLYYGQRYNPLNKSCNHDVKTPGTLSRYTQLPNRFHQNNPLNSSAESSRCVSKFGIQNLVGNIEEPSSERIFCDYTKTQLGYGDFQAEPNGDVISKTNYVYLDSFTNYSGFWRVLKKATLPDNSLEYFRIENTANGENISGTTFYPFVDFDLGAGYCSVSDSDSERRNTSLPSFFTQDTYFNKFFEALNSTLIPKSNDIFDKGSMTTLRDGNGYFLDFGDQHLTVSLKRKNRIQPRWFLEYDPISQNVERRENINSINYYISNILGLPISCNGENAEDAFPYCPNGQDSPLLVQENLDLQSESLLIDFPVYKDNYYIGGSNFWNKPVRDINVTTQNIQVTNNAGEISDGSNTIIYTGAEFNDANATTPFQLDTNVNYTPVTRYPQDYATGTNLEVYNINWVVGRGQKLNFNNGGSFKNSVPSGELARTYRTNGRLSLNIDSEDILSSAKGVRCGTFIEGDD